MKRKGKLDVMDMRRYDWSKATRGRFASRLGAKKAPVAVRIIDEDLEAAFPNSESMNAALRVLLEAARATKLKKTKATTTKRERTKGKRAA